MYKLNDKEFTISDYNNKKPFASFLPGIAGVDGIPMWVYYVNRGQAIAGFGIENKDNPIMDFVPANIAYRRTEISGFRTFIKVDGIVHEMFSSLSESKPEMTIKQNGLSLYENNEEIGVQIKVDYFNITGEDFPGLVRRVEINSDKEVEVLDGIVTIFPKGMNNEAIKNMANLSVAWIDVVDVNGMKMFKNRSTTADTAEMKEVTEGNFYASFNEQGETYPVVYDLDIIFGNNTSLTSPKMFASDDFSQQIDKQVYANKLPCAFSYAKGKKIVVNTVLGAVADKNILIENSAQFHGEYIRKMKESAYKLAENITNLIETTTNKPMFDAYMSQSFLDNVLRGGLPLVLDGENEDIIYHVYSRIHGDMEREYNYFSVEPSFYSQGNGNFRDVNQNRRNDIFFVKEAGLYNVKTFMDMIQLDGNNPLVIEGSTLLFNNKHIAAVEKITKNSKVLELLKEKFTLGELANVIAAENVVNKSERNNLIELIVSYSKQDLNAKYGHGYWVDHWTYNMDLIDNYLAVYPDRTDTLMFDRNYRFFESPDVVKPREDKYVLTDNGVRQYGSLKFDQEKVDELNLNIDSTNWTKIDGKVYITDLYTKLLTMSAVKFASLDPSGIGIMMESEKPGWNDAMNGLPGIFGSGVSETIELLRVFRLLKKVKKSEVEVPIELTRLIESITSVDDSDYFDKTQTAKEEYRESIRLGLSGEFKITSNQYFVKFIDLALDKLEHAIEIGTELGNGIIPTFLSHEAIEYSMLNKKNDNGLNLVNVTKWTVRKLPSYLEAPARLMKQLSTEEAVKLYKKIRLSEMYDEKLGMYVTSESLENESLEIGRARAFTAGWLERESCFMHMEFKYLHGMLASGLYDEYYNDLSTALPAFMDPDVYGRSPLENSSFIATSRNPNPSNHGRGFVARLTGTSTEAITLWIKMMTGGKMFKMKEDLEFELNPLLPFDYFKDGKVEFTLFGKIDVILLNNTGKDTFGENSAKIQNYELVYDESIVMERVTGNHARDIREGKVTSIIVTFK